MADNSTLITRAVLENYKSIATCDVRLGPITYLVGRNGAGKSNFLDALHFTSDALRHSLDQAIRERGSIENLRYRGAVPDATSGMRFDLALPRSLVGRYALRLASQPSGGFAIVEEDCTVEYPVTDHDPTGFRIQDGRMIAGTNNGPRNAPTVPTDRLHLAASAFPYDRPVYDALARMAFYQPEPARMRPPNLHDTGDLLLSDGSNCASVLLRLARQDPDASERITQYLQAVLPSLHEVRARAMGSYDALEFYLDDDRERPFPATAMSNGTLHALAVLTALFQAGFGDERAVTVVGIEDPEAALHPAATAVLRAAFVEAAELSQVIVTTQSADLLDDKDVPSEWILAVESRDGRTQIGPLGEGARSIVRDHLFTVGELLRRSNLPPDVAQHEIAAAHG